MAKKIDKATVEMRKLLVDKKLVIGKDLTIKRLRAKKLVKIMLAVNCAESTKESMERYCKLGSVPCVNVRYLSDELGVMCKKPFSISVIGVLK